MNVLTDSLITVSRIDGRVIASVPDVVAMLMVGPEVRGFPNLAAEQRSFWYRFLVRAGTRALKSADLSVPRAGVLAPKELSLRVRQALLEHTLESDWALYQPDPSLAGFLQPPTPSGQSPESSGYRRDDCSLLTQTLGGKGHERKVGVTRELEVESAVFALIEYQGSVVFGGRGNYESQLMGSRSGAGSGTPFMGAWISDSWNATFRHDVGVMLAGWDDEERFLQGPVWALWAEKWDGNTQLSSMKLDPAFIPMARLIRLGDPRGKKFDTVWFHTSERSRVDDHSEGGRLGDPFTPLVPHPDTGDLKVRGTLAKGYDYIEVVRLLFELDGARRSDSVTAIVKELQVPDDVRIVFEGSAYGQGKTMGFHSRVVRLPRRPRAFATLFGNRDRTASLHRDMLEYTSSAKTVLRSALALLLTHEFLANESARSKMEAYLSRLDALVDAMYLEFLYAAAEVDESDDATIAYREWLFSTIVRRVYPTAARGLPRSDGRRMQDEVRSEAYLRGRLRDRLELRTEEASGEEAA